MVWFSWLIFINKKYGNSKLLYYFNYTKWVIVVEIYKNIIKEFLKINKKNMDNTEK